MDISRQQMFWGFFLGGGSFVFWFFICFLVLGFWILVFENLGLSPGGKYFSRRKAQEPHSVLTSIFITTISEV